MERKDWIYIGVIVILVIVLVITNIEVKESEPRKERTERLLSRCDNLEICDYKPNPFGCTMEDCPETYQCWWEQRNCEPKTTPSKG